MGWLVFLSKLECLRGLESHRMDGEFNLRHRFLRILVALYYSTNILTFYFLMPARRYLCHINAPHKHQEQHAAIKLFNSAAERPEAVQLLNPTEFLALGMRVRAYSTKLATREVWREGRGVWSYFGRVAGTAAGRFFFSPQPPHYLPTDSPRGMHFLSCGARDLPGEFESLSLQGEMSFFFLMRRDALPTRNPAFLQLFTITWKP